jgi:hypothetical protein
MRHHDDPCFPFPHKTITVEDLWPGDEVWLPSERAWVKVIAIEPMNFGPFTLKVITSAGVSPCAATERVSVRK